MARPVILSNGSLAVALDNFGQVREFYFPYVGTENHVSQRISAWKIGLFVDNRISWLDDGSWNFMHNGRSTPCYFAENGTPRLIGKTVAQNAALGLAIDIDDFVDAETNVFSRNFHVINLQNRTRSVKLFAHQAFRIGEADDGHDTAQLIPEELIFGDKSLFSVSQKSTWRGSGAICHYKGARVFMVDGHNLQTGGGFDSFAIGNYGEFDNAAGQYTAFHDGSWRDAENGQLSRNPAERIATDSILEFDFNLGASDSARAHCTVAAGATFDETAADLAKFRADTTESRLAMTNQYWRDWLRPAVTFVNAKLPEDFRETFLESLLIAKTHISRNGAVIAALDTSMLATTRDAYVDCWPRDAANILRPFLQIGFYDELEAFFNFARRAITSQGFFWQMYRADGGVGPSSHAYVPDGHGGFLLPIQTDETAAVLKLLAETLQKALNSPKVFARFRAFYDDLAVKMADFLCDYVDESGLPKPSYELWEVRLETTLFTTGTTIAALAKIADFANKINDQAHAQKWAATAMKMKNAAERKFWNAERNYFDRGFYVDGRADETMDIASLRGAELARLTKTDAAYRTFRERFGVNDKQPRAPRFEGDDYHGFENPWPIASFWLAESPSASPSFAVSVLNFAKKQIAQHNVLSEQLNHSSGQPIDPAPLAWSHGEFMTAIIKTFAKTGKTN